MGNRALVHRHLDKILLGCLNALGDGCRNFVGLAQSPADDAVAVADHDNSRETERPSTLGYLGNAVDGHQAILQFQIISRLYLIVLLCHDSC